MGEIGKRGFLRNRKRNSIDDGMKLINNRTMLNKKVHSIKNQQSYTLRQAPRLWKKFPDGNLQSCKEARKRKRRDDDDDEDRGRGGRRWYELICREMKARRGPVKWMKRKLFNVSVWRARFLPYRGLHIPFSLTTVSTLLRERRFRIDSLKRATVFPDSPP